MSIGQKTKVLFVVPNFKWARWGGSTLWHYIPYNLCILAAIIRDRYEVSILDANASGMSREEFHKTLTQIQPDIVGVTVMMDQYAPVAHAAAEMIKDWNPGAKVLLGGIYATMNPERAMQDPNIDVVVMGESEAFILDLLGYMEGKNLPPERGLCYRDNGRIVNKGRAEFIRDLDSLPLPAYDLIDFPSYSQAITRRSVDSPRKFPYGRIMTSRGCPYHCVFCQVEKISGRMFRARSAENVLSEIEHLKTTYGIQSLIFDDDNLIADRKRAVEIFQGMIDRGLAMPWVAVAMAEFRMDEELVELMRASGCEYIDIAIESGSQRVLKEVIQKPVDYAHAKRMAKKARAEGIFVAANFIIGFPTETWDEILETIRFAEEIDVDYVKIFNAIPLPQTRLWDLCEREKCFKEGFDPSEVWWNAGQIETKDFSARDLTILRAYEWDRINFTDSQKRKKVAAMMGISEEELLKIRRETLQSAAGQDRGSGKESA